MHLHVILASPMDAPFLFWVALLSLFPLQLFPGGNGFGWSWSYHGIMPRHCDIGIIHCGDFSLAFAQAVVVGQDSSLACRLSCRHIVDQILFQFLFHG